MQVVENYGWKSTEKLSDHDYNLPVVVKLLPKASLLNILDAGCGNGFIAAQLAALDHQVIGIDASPDGIELASKAYPQIQWEVASAYDDLSHWMPRGVGCDPLLRGHRAPLRPAEIPG